MNKFLFLSAGLLFLTVSASAQSRYKSFELNAKGDTINRVMADGSKEGAWVIKVPELRGNPGYEAEGIFKKGEKEGIWRQYSLQGDLLAVENYLHGGKDGIQQYFSFNGGLEREESWKGFNPDAPFDTIPVYGTGSNEIIEMRIVKANQYSVKNGEWRFYDPYTGDLLRTEIWEINVRKPAKNTNREPVVSAEPTEKKKVEKTPEMLEWERKNRGKKGAIRSGETGL